LETKGTGELLLRGIGTFCLTAVMLCRRCAFKEGDPVEIEDLRIAPPYSLLKEVRWEIWISVLDSSGVKLLSLVGLCFILAGALSLDGPSSLLFNSETLMFNRE
jgi:hypothetical protein